MYVLCTYKLCIRPDGRKMDIICTSNVRTVSAGKASTISTLPNFAAKWMAVDSKQVSKDPNGNPGFLPNFISFLSRGNPKFFKILTALQQFLTTVLEVHVT